MNKATSTVQIILLRLSDKQLVIYFFIIFYFTGALGMTIPMLSPLFVRLIPMALLMSSGYSLYFHKEGNRLKTMLAFSFIFISGIGIEILGIQTGKIFGEYRYGDSLGLSILSVPLMIGVNWVFLTYASSSVFEGIRLPDSVKVILASLVMVGYDIVLEQSAPKMDMWYWEEGAVPFQNYVAWFAIAVVFHSVLKIFRINTSNPVAAAILLCQFIFFLLVFILNS